MVPAWRRELDGASDASVIRTGKDDMGINAAMADHMPAFHQVPNAVRPGDPDHPRKYLGFYRYAKILELVATSIRSGAIPMPGLKKGTVQRLGDHAALAHTGAGSATTSNWWPNSDLSVPLYTEQRT